MGTEQTLAVKTLGRYAVGDVFFHGPAPAMSGHVVKIGRKWVTVYWEQFNGAGWEKQHAPEWLDGMGLHNGDHEQTAWEPKR